jgi:hypothetical protein
VDSNPFGYARVSRHGERAAEDEMRAQGAVFVSLDELSREAERDSGSGGEV